MEITTSLVIPVTDGQIEAFSMWATNTYGTYNGYLGAFKAPAIDTYIRTHILPLKMKSILRETEPYVGVKASDIHISRLQLYRKRILDKIKYMKGKLGKLAFPIEAAQALRFKREAIIRRSLAREALEMQQRRYFAEYAEAVRLGLQFSPEMAPEIAPHKIVKIYLTNEETDTCVMDNNCVICMETHKMIDACITNCGHQFGRACLTKWTNISHRCVYSGRTRCPVCRTSIKETTEFIAEDNISLFDQVTKA
jgi:hypothetical protein